MLPLLLQLAPTRTPQNRGSDHVPTHTVPTKGNPHCALLLHPSPTKQPKIQELPTSCYFSCVRNEKSQAPAGTLENSSPEDSRIMKNTYTRICMLFLHAMIPKIPVPKSSPPAEQPMLKDWGNRTEIICTDFAVFLTLLSL